MCGVGDSPVVFMTVSGGFTVALVKGGYTQDYSILHLAVLEYTFPYLVYRQYI